MGAGQLVLQGTAVQARQLNGQGLKFVEKISQSCGAAYVYRIDGANPIIVYCMYDREGKLASFAGFPITR
jgi:hypothetical protein